MSMRSSHRRQAGFTLLELMITLVILAILMTLAVPGFQGFQRSSAVSSAASSFVAALNAARAEAIQRARPTMVVPASGSDWTTGWTVFVDMDDNGSYSSNDVLVLQQGPVSASVSAPVSADAPGFVVGSGAYVRYDLYGIPRSKTPGALPLPNGIDFSATSGGQTTKRRVILGVVGRALTCDPTKTTPVCTITMD